VEFDSFPRSRVCRGVIDPPDDLMREPAEAESLPTDPQLGDFSEVLSLHYYDANCSCFRIASVTNLMQRPLLGRRPSSVGYGRCPRQRTRVMPLPGYPSDKDLEEFISPLPNRSDFCACS
jgi:hypothetical protein